MLDNIQIHIIIPYFVLLYFMLIFFLADGLVSCKQFLSLHDRSKNYVHPTFPKHHIGETPLGMLLSSENIQRTYPVERYDYSSIVESSIHYLMFLVWVSSCEGSGRFLDYSQGCSTL